MADKFDKLLEIASDADKAELKILHNASVSCLKAYNAEPTAAKKRDLDAAREGLEEVFDRLWPVYFPDAERFKNLLEAMKYLKGLGYKIGKSKIYKDAQDKQIRVQADGCVLKKDADAYAKTLRLLGDPLKGLEASQVRKAELENAKLEQQIANLKFELAIKEGAYVPRQEADMARCGVISIIKTNTLNLFQTMTGDWIALSEGNPARIPRVIDAMTGDFLDLLDRLAKVDEFQLTA